VNASRLTLREGLRTGGRGQSLIDICIDLGEGDPEKALYLAVLATKLKAQAASADTREAQEATR
jgi:hypothetical protein